MAYQLKSSTEPLSVLLFSFFQPLLPFHFFREKSNFHCFRSLKFIFFTFSLKSTALIYIFHHVRNFILKLLFSLLYDKPFEFIYQVHFIQLTVLIFIALLSSSFRHLDTLLFNFQGSSHAVSHPFDFSPSKLL